MTKIYALAGLLLLPTVTLPQIFQPSLSQGDMKFYIDLASFRCLEEGEKTYEEIYYTWAGDQLSFIEKEGKYLAIVELKISLFNDEGEEKIRRVHNIPYILDSIEEIEKKSLFHLVGFLIEPGNYLLETTVTDRYSKKTGYYKGEIEIPFYNTGGLSLSDIELAVSIKADTSKDIFVKNGLRVYPNPMCLYGQHLPILYFYFEIYNLTTAPHTTYTVEYLIFDNEGNFIRKYPPKTAKKPGSSSVEVGGFNIVTLSPGDYRLQIKVRDDDTGDQAVSEKYFKVYFPSREKPLALTAKESRITKEVMDRFFDDVSYIATKEELEIYNSLNLEGKIRFIINFWKKRDPNPETPENEFQIEHYKRINYANAHFSRPNIPGWKTDMGRVYIKYGPPDEVERHHYEVDLRPYEIWRYYKKGGMEFVFADLHGNGIYVLLHSTWKEEIQNPDWQKELRGQHY